MGIIPRMTIELVYSIVDAKGIALFGTVMYKVCIVSEEKVRGMAAVYCPSDCTVEGME